MEPLTPLGQSIDDAVAINRAATPPVAVTQRRVPRVSIAELNAMDREQLHDRLRTAIANSDNRGPVETVLDILDLPRNAIANLVLPGVAEAKRAEGDKGTFGMGRVHFSDLLGKMGMEPGIVRGIVGFVGDVATDPLTYLGPGAVAKTASKVGEVATAGSRLTNVGKMLGSEAARVAEGGALRADDAIGRAVGAAVGGPERLDRLRAYAAKRAADGQPALQEGFQDLIARATVGKPEGNVVQRGLSRVGLADPTSTGGILSYLGTDLQAGRAKTPMLDALRTGAKSNVGMSGTEVRQLADELMARANDIPTPQWTRTKARAEAAKDLYLSYGKGTEPGLNFGENATSQIAHIPFTNIGVRVPPLSASARNAEKILTAAKDTKDGVQALAKLSPAVQLGLAGAAVAGRAAEDLGVFNDAHRAAAEPIASDIANLSHELDVLRGTDPEALGTRYPVNQQGHFGAPGEINPATGKLGPPPEGFSGLRRTIAAIDPGTVEGEKGAGVYAATIDRKLEEMIDGPRGTARGEFASNTREKYLSDPENGAKALLAHAYREKNAGRYSTAEHGPLVGLNPERLREGDTWKMGHDTFTVLGRDPESGVVTAQWNATQGAGSVDAGTRTVRIAPEITAADGSKLKTAIPASEHTFVGALPNADPAAIAARDALVAKQEQLAMLRRQHIDRVTQLEQDAKAGAEAAAAALQKADPLANGELSAQELITLGNMADRAAAQHELAQVELEKATDAIGIHREMVDKYEHRGVLGDAVDKTLNDVQKDLYHRVSADPEYANKYADLIRRRVDALNSLSQTLDTPLISVMRGEDKALAEVARAALGMADDQMGVTVFGSVARSANRYLGDNSQTAELFNSIDRFYQRIFGNRSGALHQTAKEFKTALNNPSRVMQPVAGEVVTKLHDILQAKYGADAHKYLPEASTLLYAEWYRLMAGDSPAYSLVKWGTKDEPSELAKVFARARQSGLYAGQGGAEMQAAIKGAAADLAKFVDQMGDVELKDRMLGALKPNYVPKMPTADASKEMARVNRIRQKSGPVGAGGGKQRYQVQSVTDQTRYTDAEGNARRFFEHDRTLADTITQGDWKKWKTTGELPQSILDFTAKADPRGLPNPKQASTLMQTVVDDVKSYDSLLSSKNDAHVQQYLEAQHFPTDHFELESLRGTRLWPLTGGGDIQFYNDSVPLIMASRVAQHERSWAQAQLKQMFRNTGIAITPEAAAQAKVGGEFSLRNGVKGRVLESLDANGQGRLAVKLGNDLFRTVDTKLLKGVSELETMLGGPAAGHLVPNVLANRIEDLLRVAAEPDPIIKALDKMTGVWKTATLTNPAWLVNNLIGNSWLAFSAGLRPQDVMTHSENVAKTWWNRRNPEITDAIKITLGDGRTMTGTQLARYMEQRGAWSNSLISGEALAQFGTGSQALAESKGLMRRTRDWPKFLASDMQTIPGDLAKRYGELADMGKQAIGGSTAAGDATKAAATVLTDRYAKLIGGPVNKMNTMADDFIKAVTHLSFLEQGYSAEEAATRTTRALFDFGDLTNAEATYLRRIIPFYSWIRSSTAYSLKMMMENPKYAGIAPKLQQAMDDALSGEQKLPQNMRPSWLRENLAVQVGSNPETRQALLLMSGLPVEQLYHFLTPATMTQEGFQDFIKYYGNASHPLFKYIAGVTGGVDLFSGKTIGPDGDMTLGQFTAKQIRPLSELGIGTGDSGALGRAYQQGGVVGAGARFAVGGKMQDLSDSRNASWNLRELQKGEKSLRLKIMRAQANGEDTVDLRAQLLAVYHEMIQRGVGDHVPVWAKQELSASPVPATGE